MASTLTIKQHDLEPSIVTTLKNGDGSAINLTTATAVYLVIHQVNGSVSGAFRHACTVTAATAGQVTYTWQSGDTDTVAAFNAEFEITWPTARPQTVPNTGYNTITVEADLG